MIPLGIPGMGWWGINHYDSGEEIMDGLLRRMQRIGGDPDYPRALFLACQEISRLGWQLKQARRVGGSKVEDAMSMVHWVPGRRSRDGGTNDR